MKEEPKFYAIDAAIEVAENPKYEEIIVTPARDLERKKTQGVTKIAKDDIIYIPTYTKHTTIETATAQKNANRLQAIEKLKTSTEALMQARVSSESNLIKLERHIKTLDKLQAKGIIAADDESVQTIKAQAAKRLDENPKGGFEEEIEEILGDPIEEVEIPEEEVEIPEEDIPQEEGKK